MPVHSGHFLAPLMLSLVIWTLSGQRKLSGRHEVSFNSFVLLCSSYPLWGEHALRSLCPRMNTSVLDLNPTHSKEPGSVKLQPTAEPPTGAQPGSSKLQRICRPMGMRIHTCFCRPLSFRVVCYTALCGKSRVMYHSGVQTTLQLPK